MSLELFIPGRLYVLEDRYVRVGDDDFTDECRSDARMLGLLAEHIIRRKFKNMSKPPRKQKSADLLEDHRDGFRVWEVKTTRLARVNIQQSHTKGAGRKHDPIRFANYLDSVHGIIVMDQRRLPVVAFCGIRTADIKAKFGDAPRTFPTDFIYQYSEACLEIPAK